MPRRILFLAVALLALLLAGCEAAATGATPLVRSMAWTVDTSRQATVAQVEAATEWQAFDGARSWGFGPEPVWIRIGLRAARPGETEPWIVRVRPAYLDHLSLHDPSGRLERHSGRLMSNRDEALDSIDFTFQVPPLPHERDVYLRLQSETSRVILVDAMPLRQAQGATRSEEWLLGFMVSISILFALWAAMQWWLSRDPVMRAFAFKQWLATTWAFSITGYARMMLGDGVPPEALNAASVVIWCWTIAATLWFLTTLLKDYHPSPRWLRAGLFVCGFELVIPLLQFVVPTIPVLLISNVSILVALGLPWLTLVLAPRSAERQPIPRLFLLIYLPLYMVINAVPAAMRLGLLPINTYLLAGNLSHILLDGLVMFLLLQLRARNLAVQAQRMAEHNQWIAMELGRAQQGMELEQRLRHEQSQFMHMLMHELTTPLSIVSLALGNRHNREENLEDAGRAIQDMKAIIERCVQADQLAGQELALRREDVDLPELLRDVGSKVRKLDGRLQVQAGQALPGLHTDRQLLQVVLGNLMDNAARYSAPSSAVLASIHEQERDGRRGLTLSVSNTPGQAGHPDPSHVFEKYYRASGAQRESGSGLGLYLSRQLSQSLGGSLAYRPHPHIVEFALWIPLHLA